VGGQAKGKADFGTNPGLRALGNLGFARSNHPVGKKVTPSMIKE